MYVVVLIVDYVVVDYVDVDRVVLDIVVDGIVVDDHVVIDRVVEGSVVMDCVFMSMGTLIKNNAYKKATKIQARRHFVCIAKGNDFSPHENMVCVVFGAFWGIY